MKSLPSGTYAALLTPATPQGLLDLDTFSRLVDFVVDRGVGGIVIGGATGEYPNFSVEDREKLIRHATAYAKGRFPVVAGIGCSSLAATLHLGRVAADAGCDGVLLAMPYFFRYEQGDLEAFSRTVSRECKLPSLLYHLPAFTNALTSENLAGLLKSEPHLAGVKDSSGVRTNLTLLSQARRERPFTLFVGNDALVLDALRAGWDGVISGIACFLPELLAALVDSFREADLEAAARRQAEVDRAIEEIVKLPTPWAIRIGLEVRGISTGPLPLPLSAERRAQVSAYREWLEEWLGHMTWLSAETASEESRR